MCIRDSYYTDWIKDPGYFGIKSFIKTGNLFGLQHIYGDMTNSTGVDPIDFPALSANPTEYWIVATDAATGTPVYFPKSKMKPVSYTHLLAVEIDVTDFPMIFATFEIVQGSSPHCTIAKINFLSEAEHRS